MFKIMIFMLIAIFVSMPVMANTICRRECVWNIRVAACDYQIVCKEIPEPPEYPPNAYSYPSPKPLPVYPPYGTSQCQWILINNEWQNVCW
jgi:hypothetical protein